jgi:hypothetical protein
MALSWSAFTIPFVEVSERIQAATAAQIAATFSSLLDCSEPDLKAGWMHYKSNYSA